MKETDVPQDAKDYGEAQNQRRLVYAVNKDGQYVGAVSAGWEPENLANKQAYDEAEERLLETLAKVKKGELSPIAYYMEKCRMDKGILAKYVGKWKWQIQSHFSPKGFQKLSDDMLRKYAEAFSISVAELKQPVLP